ncbi:MAG: hypothetical protein AW07_00174 [Candidatus Accumulibacter sp. SK-11]|nr:MAG: hypothetical protein AW07_00174 [Candidatus Accumulibacter sp. SK-11]
MRNEVDHIQARDPLLLEVIDRVRILLAEDRHEDIGPIHFLAPRGLDVQDCALDDALKAECRLRVDLVLAGHGGRVLTNEAGQILAQLLDVRATGPQRLDCRGVVEQRQQEVFDGDELVTLLSCLDERHVQADFKFLRNHSVLLHYTRQRVLVAACETCDLFYLGGSDVARVNATDPSAFRVHFEHDPRCLFTIHCKEPLQNDDHEVHRREIIVQQQHLVQWRRR